MADSIKSGPSCVSSPGDDPASRVVVYHICPPPDTSPSSPPVYIILGDSHNSGVDTEDGNVKNNKPLKFSPGLTICPSCQEQVKTHVTYKAGTFAWLMLILFIILGLLTCLVPLFIFPFFWRCCKDAYHSCPRCKRELHIQKRKCCKR